MNIKLNAIFHICLNVLLLFCMGTHIAVAEPDTPRVAKDGSQSRLDSLQNERTQKPIRRPPQIAIDACIGKNEGDSCIFNSPGGEMRGECLAGTENIFACRPHRGEKLPSSVQPTNPAENTKTPVSPDIGAKAVPKSHTKQSQPPEQQTSQQTTPLRSEELTQQIQPTTKLDSENPAKPANSINPRLYRMFWQFADHIGSYLVAAIIAAALTWYGFFKYSTLPLRRLRKVTQQLAGGDLSARVGEGLLHRKNEVVELGRDVDRMAERIESLVGAHQRLIRDVSHELRSPLARLNVALELARQSAGPSHSAPFDRIERESERLNELIGQLLMLTKLESESGMIKRSDFDISALITEIVNDVDYEARNLNRRVEIVENEPVKFSGNREMLRQAFENVIRNAVRYTADNSAVEITCRCKASKDRSWGHIEIRDHGPGVPESEIFNIFRPFYRVADARERQSGGTGVGLAISDRAIRLHGGSIRALNATGEGLIVEIELPLL